MTLRNIKQPFIIIQGAVGNVNIYVLIFDEILDQNFSTSQLKLMILCKKTEQGIISDLSKMNGMFRKHYFHCDFEIFPN